MGYGLAGAVIGAILIRTFVLMRKRVAAREQMGCDSINLHCEQMNPPPLKLATGEPSRPNALHNRLPRWRDRLLQHFDDADFLGGFEY